jgi:flagellar motor switch protein FliG
VKPRAISPLRQAALCLLSLDRKTAAELLRHLPRARVEEITRTMKEMSAEGVAQDDVDSAWEEFERRLRDERATLGDAAAEADLVLSVAFERSEAEAIRARVDAQLNARRPFRELESLDPKDLATLCDEEHPQVAALVIAHLPAPKAARVLDLISEDRRADVVMRIARLGNAPAGAVAEVVRSMLARVEQRGLRAKSVQPESWIEATGEILASCENARHVLDSIASIDEDLAGEIRARMFVFDDIARLDRNSMQSLLGEVDPKTLATALKVASADVERNVLDSLSRRASGMVVEERELLGPIPLRQVREAQGRVVQALQSLVERGEIQVGDRSEPLV